MSMTPQPDHILIIFEDSPNVPLSRENYDNQRSVDYSGQSVCHAPFVSLELRASGTVAPCRFSAMNLGRIQEHSLETIWTSQAFLQLRQRFQDYRIRHKECEACVGSWLDGIPSESHAVVEFDQFLMPKDSATPPRKVSLDLRAPNLESVCQTLTHWLPNLDCIDITTPWPPPEPYFRMLFDQVMDLPNETCPKVLIRTENVIPNPEDIWRGVALVELGFSMDSEDLSWEEEKALEALAQALKEQRIDLNLVVLVHNANWMHLRTWLERISKLGVVMVPQLLPSTHLGSLAHCDGDNLSCLHGIFLQWLKQCSAHSTQERAMGLQKAFLAQIRRWQRSPAAQILPRTPFVLPRVEHSVVQHEATFECLIESMLRIYANPTIESWFMEITQSKGFIENARKRRSLRLIVFWLACVFNRPEALSLLLEIFGSPEEARRKVEEDRQCLAGTSWESWFRSWTEQVGLHDLKLRQQYFQIGTIQPMEDNKPPCVTIIISSHNHQTFLQNTVLSVLGQTRTDFNLWVVDDASGDDSVQALESIKDRRLKIIQNTQNLGLGLSLARVLEKVDTTYVALLDGDDLFHPRRLEACLAVLDKNPQCDLVATGVVPVDARGKIYSVGDSSPIFDGRAICDWLRWYHQYRVPSEATSSGLLGALLEGNFLITTSNTVARADFLRKQLPHWENLEFCIDWQLFLAAALSEKLYYLPEGLLGNRLHQANVRWWTDERKWRFYLESNQVVARILDWLFQRGEAMEIGGVSAVLSAMANHLNSNTTVDWPGVFLGVLMERHKVGPRDLARETVSQPLQTLMTNQEKYLQAKFWIQDFGGNVPDLYRMRGERPFLRFVRNAHEVLEVHHKRIQGMYYSLLSKRARERMGKQQRLRVFLGRVRRKGQQIGITLQNRLSILQLTAERHWQDSVGNRRYRALATVCWDFPIYSQTFVYQELTQLANQGFNLRLIYSNLDSRKYLHPQFEQLWKIKRRLILRRDIHEQDFSLYNTQMPEKVQALIRVLCETSGLSASDLIRRGNFLEAFSFTRMVEAYRPHYIHSYFFYDRSFMALVASYLLDIPRGISCYADHLLKDYEFKLVPLHMQLCSIVIATSKRIKTELLTLAPNTDPERILVKPNAINSSWFPFHQRTDPEGNIPFRLICVSRIEPKKGLLYLIEAVHELHQRGWTVECHLIGEADNRIEASQLYKAKIDARLTELDLWSKVHMEGFQNEEGVKQFLNKGHLFVAPFVQTETGDQDGIPTALLEAMATGLPVVVTDSGSIPEVVDEGKNGVFVPQRNSVALANAIESLIRDTDRRHRYGQAAAEKVRHCFDVALCEKKFHERVQAIIEGRR